MLSGKILEKMSKLKTKFVLKNKIDKNVLYEDKNCSC